MIRETAAAASESNFERPAEGHASPEDLSFGDDLAARVFASLGREFDVGSVQQRDVAHLIDLEVNRRVQQRTAELEKNAIESQAAHFSLERMEKRFRATIEFQIFQRLHNRREYSGTGIGLALAKRIVERFQGEIRLESAEDAGSTFFFTLEKPETTED